MRYKGLTLHRRAALEMERMIYKGVIADHPLTQIVWESTLRCDLRCRHCGSDCKTMAGVSDMPVADLLRVLRGVREKLDPSGVFVTISGGEPLMRADLEDCGSQIYELGFPWGMVTNALHLTPQRFEKLVDAGIHSMAVSLDGLKEDHNWMRGNSRSFDMVEQAIAMLRQEPKVVWDIVTCVTERNFSTLPAMREWMIEHGVETWRLIDVFPMGRAASDPMMMLSDKHYAQLLQFITDTQHHFPQLTCNYGCEGFVGEYEFEVREHAFLCHAGITVAGILADGSISACTSIRGDYKQGNIYEDDFMDVWENRFKPFRDHSWMRTGQCADCNMWRYCRGNGMHLRDSKGQLLQCHLERLMRGKEELNNK